MVVQREQYTVGWICAIEVEYTVACELLDEEYTRTSAPKIDISEDPNIYTFGSIHEHNIVIACLPHGRYGVNSATIVAERMRRSFPAIRFGLMVGIAGGAPNNKHDIRLGDIVVSSPTPGHGGVIQYDFGKAVQQQEFKETGHLSPPPEILLNALSHIASLHSRRGHLVNQTITAMIKKNPRMDKYTKPRQHKDRLCASSYIHRDHGTCDCEAIDNTSSTFANLLQRSLRWNQLEGPAVHYGLIASANQLMKDAEVRDALARKHQVLCFETEAAGLMNSFPCVVIRGICDYSDTHKNDVWQPYAAATAAAFAKELLSIIPAKAFDDKNNRLGMEQSSGYDGSASGFLSHTYMYPDSEDRRHTAHDQNLSPHRQSSRMQTSTSDQSRLNKAPPPLAIPPRDIFDKAFDPFTGWEPPNMVASRPSSPTWDTRMSTEIIEYGNNGQVIKRTFSQTSSGRSSMSRFEHGGHSRSDAGSPQQPSSPGFFTKFRSRSPPAIQKSPDPYDQASTTRTEPRDSRFNRVNTPEENDLNEQFNRLEILLDGVNFKIGEHTYSMIRTTIKRLRAQVKTLIENKREREQVLSTLNQRQEKIQSDSGFRSLSVVAQRRGSGSFVDSVQVTHYTCNCCPIKPRKFRTADQLREHEHEKRYICPFCGNRYKDKVELERHQMSLHLRDRSWSCGHMDTYEAAFSPDTATRDIVAAPIAMDMCGYCGERFSNPPDLTARKQHLLDVHKFGKCNQSKKFWRADHFRQHLKHSHNGRLGKWTSILEQACLRMETPAQ